MDSRTAMALNPCYPIPDYVSSSCVLDPANDCLAKVGKTTPEDVVNHPSHYTKGEIECLDALKAATTGLDGIEAVCTANAIKYLWRWKWKNGAEDIKKSIFYLNRLLKEIEDNAGTEDR